MKESLSSSLNEKKSQMLNIAGREISKVLDVSDAYEVAYKKIMLLIPLGLELLHVTPKHPKLYTVYNMTVNHYFRTSASYILRFEDASESKKEECKKEYELFLSVILRISKLSPKQRITFLDELKKHNDQGWTTATNINPINIMDTILTSIKKTNTPKKKSHRFASSNEIDDNRVSERAAREIFIKLNYTYKYEKFLSLKKICFDNLGLEEGSKLMRIMEHYFNNSVIFIMRTDNFFESSEEEINEYRRNDKLFIFVVQRINNLKTQQKKSFLKKIEHYYTTDQTTPTPNPITVMDTILTSVLSDS